MADRTCTAPGCHKPHRARGLCSTHYNRAHQPHRHAPTPTSCTYCGTAILRSRKGDRRPVCSPGCRARLTGYTGAGAYRWAQDAATRARRAGASVVDVFTREEIFERDGWECQICGASLRPDADPFDPASPTVDHIRPLSEGGEHSRANAQAACLHCNSAKQARVAAA